MTPSSPPPSLFPSFTLRDLGSRSLKACACYIACLALQDWGVVVRQPVERGESFIQAAPPNHTSRGPVRFGRLPYFQRTRRQAGRQADPPTDKKAKRKDTYRVVGRARYHTPMNEFQSSTDYLVLLVVPSKSISPSRKGHTTGIVGTSRRGLPDNASFTTHSSSIAIALVAEQPSFKKSVQGARYTTWLRTAGELLVHT